MIHHAGDEPIDVEELRERLRRMTDPELLQFGKDCEFMCSPAANFGRPPREAFVVQRAEAQAEWRRRTNRVAG